MSDTSDDRYGYVRVSTDRQSVERQINQLLDYGVHEENIFQDTGSGGDTNREELQEILDIVESGEADEVVTVSMSRISRSITDLFNIIEDSFKPNKTSLVLLNDPLDYNPDEGKLAELMFRMLSMFSEFEREMTRERVRSGVQNAINKGKHVGRPPVGFEIIEQGDDKGTLRPAPEYDTVAQTLTLVDDGEVSKRQAAKRLETSRATINRILHDDERRQMYNLSIQGDTDE